jgi:hypothetical protein
MLNMKAIILIITGMMLVFGCTGGPAEQPEPPAQPPPEQPPVTPPPEEENDTMTCQEWCPTQPHIQCVGSWDISGIYPDCVCSFECDVQEPEENESTEEELEPFAEWNNNSIQSMLEMGLADIRSDYLHTASGQFTTDTYTWKRIHRDSLPGAIEASDSPASDMKFGGEVISSVQGSGFSIFTAGGTEDIYGLVVFSSLVTPLDSYTQADAFDIDYHSTLITKDLRDCWVTDKVIEKNEHGHISTYYFECFAAV